MVFHDNDPDLILVRYSMTQQMRPDNGQIVAKHLPPTNDEQRCFTAVHRLAHGQIAFGSFGQNRNAK